MVKQCRAGTVSLSGDYVTSVWAEGPASEHNRVQACLESVLPTIPGEPARYRVASGPCGARDMDERWWVSR